MNNIIAINNAVTMSSREIAVLTGKQHRNVKRDVENMLKELKKDVLSFERIYQDSMSRQQTEYHLDRELTEILITGYSITLRAKVIRRLHELESRQSNPAAQELSRMDILQLAMQSEEERLRLEQENRALELRIEEEAPRVAFAKQVEISQDSISVAQAAKILGTGQRRLFAFLRQIGWISRRNEPYQAKIETGYLDVKLGSFQHPEHGLSQSVTPLVTGKGLAKLQRLWSEQAKMEAA